MVLPCWVKCPDEGRSEWPKCGCIRTKHAVLEQGAKSYARCAADRRSCLAEAHHGQKSMAWRGWSEMDALQRMWGIWPGTKLLHVLFLLTLCDIFRKCDASAVTFSWLQGITKRLCTKCPFLVCWSFSQCAGNADLSTMTVFPADSLLGRISKILAMPYFINDLFLAC